MKHSKIFVFVSLLAGIVVGPSQAASNQVAEESQVVIIGKVQKPGAYAFSEKWRVIDAIAASGGVSANPASLRLSVIRSGKIIPVDVQQLILSAVESQNIPLLSGDVVVVLDVKSTVRPTIPPQRFSVPEQRKGKEIPQPDSQFFPNARFWLLNKNHSDKK